MHRIDTADGENPTFGIGNKSLIPVQAVIEGKSLEAMKCLLKHGADPGIGDDDQMSGVPR